MHKRLFLFAIAICLSFSCKADKIYQQFPSDIQSGDTYVIYSHGYIVEGDNPTPEHPRWGIYDFPAVKKALASKGDHLIAEHRPANTNPNVYADYLATQVRKLVAKGVSPHQVVLVGFSRGGFITSQTSHLLSDLGINTVLLGTCGRIVRDEFKHVTLAGNVLSVYETTDGAKSCDKLRQRSPDLVSFEELAITTGLEHGAFYRPNSAWLKPIGEWMEKVTRQ